MSQIELQESTRAESSPEFEAAGEGEIPTFAFLSTLRHMQQDVIDCGEVGVVVKNHWEGEVEKQGEFLQVKLEIGWNTEVETTRQQRAFYQPPPLYVQITQGEWTEEWTVHTMVASRTERKPSPCVEFRWVHLQHHSSEYRSSVMGTLMEAYIREKIEIKGMGRVLLFVKKDYAFSTDSDVFLAPITETDIDWDLMKVDEADFPSEMRGKQQAEEVVCSFLALGAAIRRADAAMESTP